VRKYIILTGIMMVAILMVGITDIHAKDVTDSNKYGAKAIIESDVQYLKESVQQQKEIIALLKEIKNNSRQDEIIKLMEEIKNILIHSYN